MSITNDITTDLEVLDAVVKVLQKPFAKSQVFITAEPIFLGLSYPGDEYIEVVPGAKIDRGATVGHGLCSQEIRIVCFRRLMMDIQEQDTQRLINESRGLVATVNKVYSSLSNNFLENLLVVPMHPVRQSAASVAPLTATGWASIERVFTCQYEQPFPEVQNDG